MRLTDAAVAIRPRTAWEAMDLGVLLARRHAGLLAASWALMTLPVFVLLSLLLWQQPGWAMFCFWLLKPAFDRLPLHILSRSLFGDTPRLRDALRALPGLLKPQLLASLTWRRLSLTRSFDLPVLQLEGLAGKARSQRLTVLGFGESRPASLLTVIGAHVEWALWAGLTALLFLLLPQQVKTDMDWQKLLDLAADENRWLWVEHLSNALYALLLIVWEPVYVACGFTLYLNRRTRLEAWDIELVFRRLRQRLTGVAYLLVLGGCLLLAPLPRPALADDAHSCPIPAEALQPTSKRLTHQALTSDAAHQAIEGLLGEPPFSNTQTVTRWRFGNEEEAEEAGDPAAINGFFEALRKLMLLGKHLEGLAVALKVLLWATLIGLLALLLWRYREWWFAFARRLGRPWPARTASEPPTLMFGLDVAPESLPDDVAAEVERLWPSHPREALGLLYRALLSRLLHRFQLPLKSAHTEGEVLALQRDLDDAELDAFARLLTGHWQNLAYGHRSPPDALRAQLCEGWRALERRGDTA